MLALREGQPLKRPEHSAFTDYFHLLVHESIGTPRRIAYGAVQHSARPRRKGTAEPGDPDSITRDPEGPERSATASLPTRPLAGWNLEMVRHLEAVFEDGVLRPLEPLSLPEHEHVIVTINDRVPAPVDEGQSLTLQAGLAPGARSRVHRAMGRA